MECSSEERRVGKECRLRHTRFDFDWRTCALPISTLFGRKRYNEDGVGGLHVYSPWWLDNKKLDFPRGYHIEYWGGMGQPAYGFMGGIESFNGKYLVNGVQFGRASCRERV